jgi:hypothetical protein
MDAERVLMLAAAVGVHMHRLSDEQKERVRSDEFWDQLLDTDEGDLTDEQRELIGLLGMPRPARD